MRRVVFRHRCWGLKGDVACLPFLLDQVYTERLDGDTGDQELRKGDAPGGRAFPEKLAGVSQEEGVEKGQIFSDDGVVPLEQGSLLLQGDGGQKFRRCGGAGNGEQVPQHSRL